MSFSAAYNIYHSMVKPCDASIYHDYYCIECHQRLLLKHGPIIPPYFSHRVDTSCEFFNRTGESSAHKLGKFIVKDFIDARRIITMKSTCCLCTASQDLTITYRDTMQCELEYFTDRTWIADVAILDSGGLLFIIEIMHTHKTTKDRPVEWYEVSASDVVSQIHSSCLNLVNLRKQKCNACIASPPIIKCPTCYNKITLELHNSQGKCDLCISEYVKRKTKRRKIKYCGICKKRMIKRTKYKTCKHFRCKKCSFTNNTCSWCSNK